ncbi:PAS domain S-box protein [uncultured Draconibacterium sp.]|uniref:PAS domain S-box protein n=1 Tax=uncultured Draconibacterium sp. TaxID=1573823 RepID=UPI0032167745
MDRITESKSDHFHRIIDTLKAINKVLIHTEDSDVLIRNVCEVLTVVRGHYFSWIGLFNRNDEMTSIESSGKAIGFSEMKKEALNGKLHPKIKEVLHKNEFTIIESADRDCPIQLNEKDWTTFIAPLQVDNELHGLLCSAIPVWEAKHEKEAQTYIDIAKSVGYAISNLKEKQDMKGFLATAKEAYATFDKDLNYTSTNDAFCQIFECTPNDIIGKNILTLAQNNFTPDQAKKLSKVLDELKKGADIQEFEIKFRNKILKLNTQINQLQKYRIAKITDVTKERAEQEKLKKSESKYRSLVDGLNDAMFILQDGVIKFVNPSLSKISGFTEEELLNSPFTQFIEDSEVEKILELYKKRLSGKRVDRIYESVAKSKSGAKIPVEVTVIPVQFEEKPAFQIILHDISLRQETLQQLKESEERYRFLSNSAFEGILIHHEGTIQDVNNAMLTFSGYTREELMGRNIYDFLHSSDDADLIAKNSFKETNDPYLAQAITKSGKVVLMEIQSREIIYNGKSARIAGIRDITERHQLSQKVFETTNQLNNLLNNLPGMAYTCLNNKDWEMVFMSKGCIELTGYTPDNFTEADGITYNDIIHPDFTAYVWNTVQDALDKEQAFELEYKIKCKNGQEKWVWERGNKILRNNKVLIEGFISDISQRKIAQENLSDSEHLLDTILQSMPSGFVMIDKEYKIRRVNEQTCKITGYRSEELEGQSCDIICPKGQHSNRCPVWANGKDSFTGMDTFIKCKGNSNTAVLKNAQTISINGERFILESFQDITEWKQAEKLLIEAKNEAQESEQKFTAFMNFMPGMAFIKDRNLNFIYVNQFMAKNMDAANWVGKNTREVTHTPLLKEVIKDDEITFIQGRHKYEEQFPVNGRGPRDFLTHKFTIGEDKSLLGGISIDITERKKLESRNTMLSKAIEASPASVVITDTEGNIQYVNPFFEDKTGYTLQEVIGKNPRILKSGKQSEEFYKNMWDTVLNGQIWRGEFHNKKKNGQLYWEKGSISPVTNGDGKIVQFIAIKEDITQQKKILAELNKAKEEAEKNASEVIMQKEAVIFHNERLESLFRISQLNPKSTQELLDYALNEAVNLTASKIGYIYFYNETTRQFTLNTWSREVMKECKVQNPETVYDLDSTGCWGEAVRQRKPVIINDYSAENEFKKGTPEGHIKLQRFLTVPVFSDNQIVAVAGVANKSNDYIQADIRQLSLLMDNVWKISERIKLIEDLQIEKERAEESDKLKSAFLANMSHEIRTPMNGILGFTELLKDPNLSGEQQNEFISIIQKSGDRMLSTINDIIDISKIESGLVTLNMTLIDLKSFMTDILLFFEPETAKKKLFLKFLNQNDFESPMLQTDPEKLNSIITNLIKNAIKFTFEGGISFGYTFSEDSIQFIIKDTGIGIPLKRQEAIFDRFVQADIADSRVFEGSGLGLSISRSYSEMLGGTIRLESEESLGTTFYVSIPTTKTKAAQSFNEEGVSEIGPSPQNLKILIADDDAVSVDLLKIFLKDYCQNFIVAENGEIAVEKVKEHGDIDLVLMDVKMPLMDGFDATKRIRAFNTDVKIIAQTAFVQEQDIVKALNVGCNNFISKPINKHKLLELVQSMF